MDEFLFVALILFTFIALVFMIAMVIIPCQQHSSAEQEMLNIGNQARKEIDVESSKLIRETMKSLSVIPDKKE